MFDRIMTLAYMKPMQSAPKGVLAKYITDPEWVEPPMILLFFNKNKVSVGCWDWYYAEDGAGYTGGSAWIEPVSGQQLYLEYGEPIGWMPIPPTED